MANLDENATVSRVPEKKSGDNKSSDSSKKNGDEDKDKSKDRDRDKGDSKKNDDKDSGDKSDKKDKDSDDSSDNNDDTASNDKNDESGDGQNKDSNDKNGSGNDKGDDGDDDDGKKDKKKQKKKKKQAANLATQAAGNAAKFMIKAQIMQFMHNMMLYMMQLMSNIATAITTAVQAIAAMVAQVVTTVAAALAVSVTVATLGIVGVVAVVVVTAVVVVADAVQDQEIAQRDTGVNPCIVDYVDYTGLTSVGDAEADVIAQDVYSALSTYGLPDVNIAGILGNWTCESGIDSTSVETIFDEKYAIGPRKQEAMDDWNDFTENTVFPAYSGSRININESGYQATDGNYYPGIGLGQWTGERARMLIVWAQNATNAEREYNWYDLDVQLSFMIGGDTRKSWIESWATESTPEFAAKNFMEGWEGISSSSIDSRQQQAAYYFMLMGEWEVDAEYGQSIIELAGTTSIDGDARAAVQNYDECGVRNYENSSIAKAAISFAWDNKDMAKNNDGTSMYKAVCEAVDIVPPGPYQECAAVVAAAVRWSGSDDDYPAHGVQNQLDYVESSWQWKEIPWDGTNINVLKPGDIFIIKTATESHTFVYVGEEKVNELRDWVDSPMDVVAGSYSADNTNGRSAGLENHFYVSAGAQMAPSADYRVFRLKFKDLLSSYKNALDSGH